MAKLDITTIVNRSIRGFFTLTIVQILNSALIFLLAGIIDTRTFGVFIVVSASLSFLSYFSDVGLAAALIQKKGDVKEEDLTTTFTIQQFLVLSTVIVGFIATPFVSNFYELDIKGTQLFQALLLSFFLSSLKSIPSILLVRNLQFQKLSIPQIAETFALNIVAVFLSLKGFGVTSFTYAVLARGAIGVILMYIVSPWNLSIGISKKSAKKLFSFGVPFQANSILALVKDDLLTIILGKILSFSEVGQIGFAQKSAFLPLRLIMDKIIQVTFPAFSRLQDDRKTLKIAIEKILFSVSFIIFPSTVALAILAPYVIDIIPKYGKWEAAMPSLTFFAINALFSSISTPLTNILNAIGKVRVTFGFMIFWTVATWLLTLLLIQEMGFVGVSMASAIVASSVFFVVIIIKRHVDFDIVKPIGPSIVATVIMGVVLYYIAQFLVKDLLTLILSILVGGLIYVSAILFLAKNDMVSDIRTILRHLRHSSSKL